MEHGVFIREMFEGVLYFIRTVVTLYIGLRAFERVNESKITT